MGALNSLNRFATALCAAVVLFAGAAATAGAQAMPSPAPSAAPPAGGTNPGTTPINPIPSNSGGQSTTPARPLPPLSHLPIIDFVVTFTQPAYYTNSLQLPAYDPIDLGGTVRIPITRKFNLLFDRITEGTVNQPLERSGAYVPGVVPAPAPGTPCTVAKCLFTSSKDTRDIILQYHATYAFNRYVTLDAGESFRHRVFASGTGTAATGFPLNTGISNVPFPYTVSSTEHHFAYAGVSYTTKPYAELLHSTFVFSLTGDAQNVDHNVAVFCTAANKAAGAVCGSATATQVGYLDEHPGQDRYYESTQGVSMIVPVDPKHGTSFLLNERWGALNFYENAVAPYRWSSALTYQLSKRFSPGFTLALRHSDYHSSSQQSAPFISPNSIHVGSWDIIGTFHVDTNTFFH